MGNLLARLRRRDRIAVLRLEGVIGAGVRLGAPALTDAGLAPVIEAAFRRGIFDLRAGATWTDAEIAKDNITPANEGNTPRRQADFVYQVTPALEFDIVRTGLNIVGTTKAYAQDSNELVFPAFTQVNAFVNVRPMEKLELSVNANNLFNTVGITESEEGSIVAGVDNYVRARSINGRTVSASVRFDF